MMVQRPVKLTMDGFVWDLGFFPNLRGSLALEPTFVQESQARIRHRIRLLHVHHPDEKEILEAGV